MGYLAYLEDEQANRWEVLRMDWCVDFGGRQCQIECQRQNGDGNFPTKTFVIYGLDGEFTQWNNGEVGDHEPIKGDFYTAVMGMFSLFDNTNLVSGE